MIVAESLESHDELEAAHKTFTEAVELLLADAEQPPRATHPLLFGRHRVRRMMGAAHDDWDMLADTLHSSPVSLDELHDPKRVWSLGSENPAELEAEIAACARSWAPTARPSPAPSLSPSCTGRRRNWPNSSARTATSPRSTPPTRPTWRR